MTMDRVGYVYVIPIPVAVLATSNSCPSLYPILVEYLNFYLSAYPIGYRDIRLARYPQMHNKKTCECFIGEKFESARQPNPNLLDAQTQTESIKRMIS